MFPILILFLISSFVFFKIGLYRQKRVGKNGSQFFIYKIRSMSDDKKVSTSFGKFIRKYKFDEFPQLFNILIGDMSFVGPRPEVPIFFLNHIDYPKKLFKLRPGLTGLASLYYFNEDELQLKILNDNFNKTIYLRKNKLNLIYLANNNFCYDIHIICKTLIRVLRIK